MFAQVILKTYVSLALRAKRYETRLKQTVEISDAPLISDVQCFAKHPHVKPQWEKSLLLDMVLYIIASKG